MKTLHQHKFLDHLAKAVRILTIPPVILTAFCFLLNGFRPEVFHSRPLELFFMILFLGIIPTLAYPLHAIIPALKRKGRIAQRWTAFVFAGTGYLAGLLYGFLSGSDSTVKLVYTVYFITFVILTIVNILKIKASAHASGTIGPLILIVIEVSPWFALSSLPIYFLSLWASVRLKRHTVKEYVIGSLCCGAAIALSYMLSYFLF